MSYKEFGSDFHSLTFENIEAINFPDNFILYGAGRYAINDIILNNTNWKTIYIPDYFCYDVVDYIKKTGIEIKYYEDNPLNNDEESIAKIDFSKGDVLLRMNFFGIRGFRDNSNIEVPVIEDHSHNLFSDWAINSNADWCVASLRKSLPIPDGGISWSPKNYSIEKPILIKEHSKLALVRSDAMLLKKAYLFGEYVCNKNDFLKSYRTSEALFGEQDISSISNVSLDYLKNIPKSIDNIKKINYNLLKSMLLKNKIVILEENKKDNPFSFVILFESLKERNRVREILTRNNLYTAILWKIENKNASKNTISFSNRMLSLPIDIRYSKEDIIIMSNIINNAIYD